MHLARAARLGNPRARQELAGPPFPRVLGHLWRHFTALDRWRGGGGMGLMPLTLHDVDAYARHYGWTPTPPELDVVKALDAERLVATLPDRKERP